MAISRGISSVVDRNGAVVLDAKRGVIMTMNAMGGFVWKRLEERVTLSGIARELAEDTGAELGEIEADLREFAAELRAAGLLTP